MKSKLVLIMLQNAGVGVKSKLGRGKKVSRKMLKSRSQMIKHLILTLLATSSLLLAGVGFRSPDNNDNNDKNHRNGAQKRDWPAYGGAPENNHYSRLAVAWSFDSQEEGLLQASPSVVDGVLYGITPTQKIFALDAATGSLLWKFDSGIRGTQPDRGLAYWSDRKESDGKNSEVNKND